MADYEKKDLEKYLKNYISQLKGKSEKEQLDYLSNTRDKRTKEIKAEDPTVEVQYHPELDALGMLYQSVANGNDPKLEYDFDDDKLDHEVVNDFSIDAIKDNFTPPGAKSQKEDVKDEIDTNDNGKIEVDEMADFQKSLDDYAAKNKKGRDDIPVTTRRR